jgi:branched-chain amino acid transport system substrate-binding protein
MGMTEKDETVLQPLTRRRFLRSSAVSGGVLASSGILAACGSSSPKKSTTSTGSGTTAAGSSSQLETTLQGILGKPTNILSKGPGSFKVAGQFALTGAGAIYGVTQTAGWKYGVQHVNAWTGGKLDFATTYYDNQSGIPAAEAAAGRQAGLNNVPVLVNSYIFGFGAILPFAAQYKMFSPDPGGGAGPNPGPYIGKPYCYGFRAGYPTDCLDGIYKYMRQTFPQKKKWVSVQPVIAPPYNDAVSAYEANLNSKYGVESLGTVLAPLGATNYSSTIAKIKSLNPDIVMWTSFGTDPGYQAKEMASQGVNAINIGVDFTPALATLGGSALKGWYFGFDYLNTVKPPNPWSKFFVSQWQKDHGGATPDFYNAGDYITCFALARMMNDIIGSGGDINSGAAYVKALEANPAFPHVYGGTASKLGQIIIDPTSHSPKAIPMLIFRSLGTGNTKDITPLATYNIKAADFKLI